MSFVIPTINRLIQLITDRRLKLEQELKESTDDDVKVAMSVVISWITDLEANINHYFNSPLTLNEANRPFLVATYLDPRFKDLECMAGLESDHSSVRYTRVNSCLATVRGWVREDFKKPINKLGAELLTSQVKRTAPEGGSQAPKRSKVCHFLHLNNC
jgi:hypothetical protein